MKGLNGWSRLLVLLFAVMLVLPQLTMAQDDDDDYEWKTWRTRRSHAGFNGFGGFFYGGQELASTAMNNLTTSMGLPKLDSQVGGMGGFGMGHLGNGWRIGGLGFGYQAASDGVYTDPNTGNKYNRKVEMLIGGGGFLVEYSPWMIGPVNLGVGSVLGWGSVQIEISQDSGAFTWSDLTSQYVGPPSAGENITTTIMQPFAMAEPYITARVHILDWMAFTAMAGYHFNSMQSTEWYNGDQKLVGHGPDLDMNNVFYRVGLVFGG